jgi:drug/metabolite transporter (DMT)-like permease
MLVLYGASRASLVTYLIPFVAVVYGVALLGEELHANAILGLLLIVGGVALGSGVYRSMRRGDPLPVAPRS